LNSGEEIPGEFVVPRSNSAEIFESAKATFDDISSPVSLFIEAIERNAIGFVGDYGFCTTVADLRPEPIAVVTFVGNHGAHVGRERQNIRSCGNVGILSRCQMKNNRPTKRIAQRVDFCRAPTARTADRLIAFPPFPPEAQR
jgi:hypothetical protein